MTADGGAVVFWAGDGVTPGDANSAPDVFLRGPFP